MRLEKQNLLFFTRTMGQGGTENIILQLCEILQLLVNKIVVCSCGGVNVKVLDEMGIKHYTIPDISKKKLISILKVYRELKRIIREEKITVIHSHHRMAALYTEFVAPTGVVKIANAHNTFTDKKKLTRLAYRNTRLIAVGEMVKRNLVDVFNIPDQQVAVIHNAVKPFDGNIQSIAVLEQERRAGHVLVGNVGRLSEQKGMSYFIEAAEITLQKYPEARFFIIGDGEDKAYLHSLVKDKGLTKAVFFLGYRTDVQNAMSQLDFIVLSSLWEGLPLTPIEAYSVGKPVIGTAVDGTPEIIKDSTDGYLVEAKNPKAIAEKVNYLIEHRDICRRMGEKALEKYQREFSLQQFSNRYINFYKEI